MAIQLEFQVNYARQDGSLMFEIHLVCRCAILYILFFVKEVVRVNPKDAGKRHAIKVDVFLDLISPIKEVNNYDPTVSGRNAACQPHFHCLRVHL